MQTRSSDENSVRLSVCLSVRPSHAWIVTKRKKDLSRFIYHTKEHLAQFSEKKNGWWGATFSTWNFGSTGPRWSSSAVTPSEKSSVNANRKSTARFQMSLRWSSYVAPKSPKGGLKNAKRPMCVKNGLRLKKSATKFLYVKTVSGKVVRHPLA